MNPPAAIVEALTACFAHIIPEVILGVTACVLFLGSAWRSSRDIWGAVALVGLAAAALALCFGPKPSYATETAARASLFAGPLAFDHLTGLIRVVALLGAGVLVLLNWDEVDNAHAGEFHACLLVIAAGVSLGTAANELVTLFLGLELVSIPTYVLLYLTKTDAGAQEAAMKYFLLSIFSSAFLLFGFSYLYGLTGTTNLPAIHEALAGNQGAVPGIAVVALVMIVAALGFKMTAVPFHFYAPDVYQGTSTGAAAMLAFMPKIVGFTALMRVFGLVPLTLAPVEGAAAQSTHLMLGDQVAVLLWIMAAVTMSLGNVLALLQDNVKRMLAYSSVAHAGYMLIGLAVAPRLASVPSALAGGVDAVLFYLVAYGAMTIGAFAVLAYLSTPHRSIETLDDLAGVSRTHPGTALLMVLFLFSLLGMPMTAGFIGKMLVFWGALGVPTPGPDILGRLSDVDVEQLYKQATLFRILAVIAAINSAIGAWYYLRVAAVMFLREPLEPIARRRSGPGMAAIWICAAFTLFLGIWSAPLIEATRHAAPRPNGGQEEAALVVPPRAGD